MSNYSKRVKEVLEKLTYFTIATSSKNGHPRNSLVSFVCDKQLNIYWLLDKTDQHSKNIRENEDLFIIIDDPAATEDTNDIYILAKAYEVTEPNEIIHACHLKNGADYSYSPHDFLGNAAHRVYKAVLQKIWINDAEIPSLDSQNATVGEGGTTKVELK